MELDVVSSAALEGFKGFKWFPNEGPQEDAYFCMADVTYYGGAAGGGKSDLMLGLALNEFTDSRIYRKQSVDLRGLIKRFLEIVGTKKGFDNKDKVYRDHGLDIEFCHISNPGDEQNYQGRARQFHAFDEAVHFTEQEVSFVLGWMRDAKGGHCRALLASNPPQTSEGMWIVKWFAPWIDEDWEGEKAMPGELRYAIHNFPRNEDVYWLEGPGVYREEGDKLIKTEYTKEDYIKLPDEKRRGLHLPRSYTFIPAKLDDNPYLKDSDYRQTIMAMPEPMRSKLLYGDFKAETEDHPEQLLPSAWVREAQDRWHKDGWRGTPLDCIGADVAQGGPDRTVFIERHDFWFAEPDIYDGVKTPDGPSVWQLLAPMLKDGCRINIDVGGGYGNDAYRQIKEAGVPVAGLNGAKASVGNDRSGHLQFFNKRAEWGWGLREALDPTLGEGLALPPGRKVLAELTAIRYRADGKKLILESKKDLKARIGFSPDIFDGVMYAYADEPVVNKSSSARGRQMQKVAKSSRRTRR